MAPICGSLHRAGAEHQKKRFNDTIVLNHFSLMTNVPQQVSSSPFLQYICGIFVTALSNMPLVMLCMFPHGLYSLLDYEINLSYTYECHL